MHKYANNDQDSPTTRRSHINHTKDILGEPNLGNQGDCTTGHLLHKTILLRLGAIAVETQTQTQRCSQNEETKKHAYNEKMGEIFRKIAKRNGDKQFIRYRIKKMAIRMLLELNEN